MTEQTDLLDADEFADQPKKRRKLLPLWIKIFIWIFFIPGALMPFAIIAGIIGMEFRLELYGVGTNDPFSLFGILIIILFTLKFFVSYGLWTGKRWAITVGVLDAAGGIILCGYMMWALLPDFIFRLELLFLVPYMIWLVNVRKKWEH